MALPTRGGVLRTRVGSLDAAVDISDVPTGAWMVLVGHYGNSGTTIIEPEGWAPLTVKQTHGTRSARLYGRTKQPGDTSVKLTSDVNLTKNSLVIWGTGAKPVEDWDAGLFGVRQASNAVAGQSVHAGDSFHSVAPGLTTDQPNSLVLSILFEATTATETSFVPAPTGATLWTHYGFAEGNTETEVIAYTERTTPGATSEVSVEYPNSQASNGSGIQLAIPGLADAPPAPVGMLAKLGDGSDVYVSYLDGVGDRKAPATAKILLPGFADVNALLATSGATWAHRGGSADFPEMSEYAYDQAAMRGFGAIEFSCQRTSDGWWFGIHDNNLAHTTGNPALTATINTYTRAQIEAQVNVTNPHPQHASRPFWGLIEFLDKWTPTHVVIVDPKNALSFNTEFLDILDDHGGPEKIIWKFSGVGAGAGAGALAAAARGYQTWGYFYGPDTADGGSTNLATFGPNWTLLGMAHGASQAAWDEALAFGKPVVGHIAATQANYNTAISKGASMVQCSGVVAIKPVGAF